MALDRFLAKTLEADARNRALAPETARLADLLTSLSEAQSDPKLHASLGLIAGTVGDWSRRGYNLNTSDLLTVVEAAFKALGARS